MSMRHNYPDLLVIDVKELLDFDKMPSLAQIHAKFPVKDLLTIITSFSSEADCSEVLYGEIEDRFTNDELEYMDYITFAEIQELIIGDFYSLVDKVAPDKYANHKFHSWLDKHSIVLAREDYDFETEESIDRAIFEGNSRYQR